MRRSIATPTAPPARVVLALAAALVVLAPASGQAGNSTGPTRTQTYHQGEPHTGQPGGAPGRTTGKTGTQSPFGLPPWPGSGPIARGPLPPPYDELSAVPSQCIPLLQTDWREFEYCMLMTLENQPHRLPSISSGVVETWGRSSASYNCYAYAADRRHPGPWVGPRFNGLAHPGDVAIRSPQELFDFYTRQGWRAMPYTPGPPPPGEERVVLYGRSNGSYEHAALVTAQGVFAKMGELGVFRFSSLDQMTGPAYGTPTKMFYKRFP